jgi:hypothetical protein
MQHQFPELFVAHKQADLQRELEQNILVRQAKGSNVFLRDWTANKMHDLSVWMMCTGERLHERYHTSNHLSHLHRSGSQAR